MGSDEAGKQQSDESPFCSLTSLPEPLLLSILHRSGLPIRSFRCLNKQSSEMGLRLLLEGTQRLYFSPAVARRFRDSPLHFATMANRLPRLLSLHIPLSLLCVLQEDDDVGNDISNAVSALCCMVHHHKAELREVHLDVNSACLPPTRDQRTRQQPLLHSRLMMPQERRAAEDDGASAASMRDKGQLEWHDTTGFDVVQQFVLPLADVPHLSSLSICMSDGANPPCSIEHEDHSPIDCHLRLSKATSELLQQQASLSSLSLTNVLCLPGTLYSLSNLTRLSLELRQQDCVLSASQDLHNLRQLANLRMAAVTGGLRVTRDVCSALLSLPSLSDLILEGFGDMMQGEDNAPESSEAYGTRNNTLTSLSIHRGSMPAGFFSSLDALVALSLSPLTGVHSSHRLLRGLEHANCLERLHMSLHWDQADLQLPFQPSLYQHWQQLTSLELSIHDEHGLIRRSSSHLEPIGRCARLERLIICVTTLPPLPDSFSRLTSLRQLTLMTFAPSNSFPESLALALGQLTALHLKMASGCSLYQQPFHPVLRISSLQSLTLWEEDSLASSNTQEGDDGDLAWESEWQGAELASEGADLASDNGVLRMLSVDLVPFITLPENERAPLRSVRRLQVAGEATFSLPQHEALQKLAWKFLLDLNSLECLHIRALQLLPQEIRGFQGLKSLSLTKCLGELPPLTSGTLELQVLSFVKCPRLTFLPNSWCAPTLRVLSFKDCTRFQRLPSQVASLTKLRLLSVHNCPLFHHLPSELPYLERLRIHMCPSLREESWKHYQCVIDVL